MIRALRYTSGLDKVDAAIALQVATYYMTLEAWVYVATLPANPRPVVWVKTPAGGTLAILTITGSTLSASFTDNAGRTLSRTGTLTTHKTSHVMMVWRYDLPIVLLYVDKVLTGGATTSPPAMTHSGSSASLYPVQIGGATGDALTTGFAGWIGWVRISKTARTASSVSLAGTPPAVDSNTLAQWNMAEGTGAVLDDAVGVASHDGAITGARWSYLPQPMRHLNVGPRSGPA